MRNYIRMISYAKQSDRGMLDTGVPTNLLSKSKI